MKTSNIILSILAGSTTFFILAGAIQLRVTGVPTGSKRFETQLTTEPLQPFRYLVVRDAINLTVASSDKNQITAMAGKNDPAPVLEYAQHGDTLIISRIAHGSGGRTLEVTVETTPGAIEYINADRSMFSLRSYHSEAVVIDLNDTHMSIYSNDRSVRYRRFRLHASNSANLNIHRVAIDTADVELDHSEVSFDEVVKIRATLKNDSKLHANNPMDVEYKRDESSNVY